MARKKMKIWLTREKHSSYSDAWIRKPKWNEKGKTFEGEQYDDAYLYQLCNELLKESMNVELENEQMLELEVRPLRLVRPNKTR